MRTRNSGAGLSRTSRRSSPNSASSRASFPLTATGSILRSFAVTIPWTILRGKSFDLLADLQRRLGFRIKLDDLARDTLGYQKTGNGLEIVQWWREGRKEEVCSYCENDVKLLVDLMEFARKNKYVVVKSRQRTRGLALRLNA